MGAGILPGKKQDFGLTQSTMLAVECPLRARSGRKRISKNLRLTKVTSIRESHEPIAAS